MVSPYLAWVTLLKKPPWRVTLGATSRFTCPVPAWSGRQEGGPHKRPDRRAFSFVRRANPCGLPLYPNETLLQALCQHPARRSGQSACPASCTLSVTVSSASRTTTRPVSIIRGFPTWPPSTTSPRPSPRCANASISSGGDFDLANDQREFEDLERRSSDPAYWDNPDEAQLGMRRMGELRARLDTWRDLEKSSADLGDLLEMAVGDPEMMGEIEQERDALLAKLDKLELESALNGPHDRSNAILIVHSGEGGIDAQDWASMLARMYLRWGERKGFKVEMLDSTDGE
ncbi:MAG TPA: PCRF domain-containing protein, partial [Thermomicrobiales bacterium]|nr:PCRF domain-containing protein [Thermomicrobiales bacterium]